MKKRLDILLFEKNLFNSREKAKEAIESGIIFLNGKPLKKAGEKFEEDENFNIVGGKLKYVSRGGLKLEHAIKNFNINLKDKIVLDVGASTGGFTDCCLQNGALKVYALDVGTSQLNNSLKQNPKVINLEKTNIKDFNPKNYEKIDVVVCDVSFISLTNISVYFSNILDTGKELIVLIKPQFEAGIKEIKKCKGVIKDDKVRERTKSKVIDNLSVNFNLINIDESPIKGTEGNVEYIAYFIKK